MSSTTYIATLACVEAMKNTDFVVEFFKMLKNGKPIKQKLNLFLETIVNPCILGDSETEHLIKILRPGFFENEASLETKQKLTGFYLRLNCTHSFCNIITSVQLHNYVISPLMLQLNEIIKTSFEPVVMKIIISNKSHSNSQIKAFKNINYEQFEEFKGQIIKLNRKMNKFEVWKVKKDHENAVMDVINTDNSETEIDDAVLTANINSSAVIEGAKKILDTGYANMFEQLDYQLNITEYFNNFCESL